MRRMSDGTFITKQPDMDDIYAIRIENGEYYFLGWMEDAEGYNIQIAQQPKNCLLERDCFSDTNSLYNTITASAGYQKIDLISSANPYQEFLSHVRNYERNGIRDEDDHDIFVLAEEELYAIIDALRDGDYVFVIEN